MAYLPGINVVGAPAGLPVPRVVATANAVTAQDVVDQEEYVRSLKKLRAMTSGAVVTVVEYADAASNRAAAVEAYGGAGYAGIIAALNNIQGNQQVMSQQLSNQHVRAFNSRATHSDLPLRVLPKETAAGAAPLGALPPVKPGGAYPNNQYELLNLTHAEINALAVFYGENLGNNATPVSARRSMLGEYIGCWV